MKDPKVRKLTETEIEAFPGDSSVNVAIRSSDGVEYYGDACADYPDGDEVAQFITDEGGDYIPVSRFEKIAALARAAQAMEAGTGVMTIEDFNAESVHIQHDLAEYREEYNHDGTPIRVDTPWAMGFVNEQGVPLI